MKLVAKLIVGIVAFSSLSIGAANKIQYQQVTGQIQVTVDPLQLSIGKTASDVIIIVDDSGSMASHQQRFSIESGALIQGLSQMENTHIGVLTTSVENVPYGAGVLRQPWIQSDDLQFADKLKSQILVGTEGDGQERPFDSILKFLSQREIGNNAGFWREDAGLTIIIITDAEDQSLNAGSPFEFAYTLFQAKKASGLPVGMHAVLIPSEYNDELCYRDDTVAKPLRIEEVVGLFKGSLVNLCSSRAEYNLDLEKISQDIVKRLSETKVAVAVPLKYQPITKSIIVKYGDLFLQESKSWKYNEKSNRIEFQKDFDWSQQQSGTLLKIQFELAE